MNKKILLAILFLVIIFIIFYSRKRDKYSPKVAFITAIYGNYDATCKKFKKQKLDTDFICFTDNENIEKNGWVIDTNPYHYTHKSKIDNDTYVNSYVNNKHTYNLTRYYKENYYNIPRLKDYDVIIWIDGTIEIINENTSEIISNKIKEYPIIGWENEILEGSMLREVEISSNMSKFNSDEWIGQKQPVQDIRKQYNDYINDGYKDDYWKNINPTRKNFGCWITCFIAFDNKNQKVREFLDFWFLQMLKYSTQDQVSLSYVSQKLNMIPYTLPDKDIKGDFPHQSTDLYIRHSHGK